MLRQRVRQREMHMPLQQMRLLLDENSVTNLNTYLNTYLNYKLNLTLNALFIVSTDKVLLIFFFIFVTLLVVFWAV
jgi:hypothetical protein